MIIPKYDFVLYKYTTDNLEFEKGYVINENGLLKKVEDDKYCVVYFREVMAKNTFVAVPRTLRVSAARLIELKYITVDGLTKTEVVKTTPLVEDFTRLVERVALQSETAVYHIEYFAINNKSSNEVGINEETLFYEGSLVTPHYKTLSKKYSKENSQQFFRQSLEGKVVFFNGDYEKINASSLNTKFALYVYSNNQLYVSTTFSKLDCKFDKSKKSAEPKLTIEDDYSVLLNRYENTYDLIKLAPAITRATYKKRPALQLYVQGGNTVSTYFNGLYEEEEVSEVVDDEKTLLNAYHFGKAQTFQELNIPFFEAYMPSPVFVFNGIDSWVSLSGAKLTLQVVYTKGQYLGDSIVSPPEIYSLSSDSRDNYALEADGGGDFTNYYAAYDIYKIVWVGIEEQGTNFRWESERLYTIREGTYLKAADSGYTMVDGAGHKYDLAKDVVSYNIWARLVGDSVELPHDLTSDDFALPRANYKKCVGLSGEGLSTSIYQSTQTSKEPTKYGVTDYGTYFTNTFFDIPADSNPYTTFLPLARNSWVNSALWVTSDLLSKLTDSEGQKYEDKYTTDVTLKDGFQLTDVIKALLKEVDPSLKHEATEDYSLYLYSGKTNVVNGYLNYKYLITPKSNILKGNYDQAAQKAELSFKDLMDMLRACFRCYWFVDEQKRFRIEHISYFMRGGGYTDESEVVQLDLTKLPDKFNRKMYAFFQNEIAFDKAELVSRYEFSWMDAVSDAMGNIAIDIKDLYTQKDKSENISATKFSTDIDLMLLLPTNFSNDGFALIAVDETNAVPTIPTYLWDETRKAAYYIKAQNYPLAWSRLINNYLYDMPGKNISYNTVPPVDKEFADAVIIGPVKQIKKCMTHSIQFPVHSDPSPMRLIRTEIGDGTISEMLINIDTQMVSATLQYYPE